MENDETRVHHLGDSTPWPGAAPLGDPAADEIASGPAPASRARRVGTAAALVVGGMIAGTIGISAVQAATGSTQSQQPTAGRAAPGQAAPGQMAPNGAVPNRAVPNGTDSDGTDSDGMQNGVPPAGGPGGRFGGPPGGGLDGEQRLSGTVAAIGGSSITVTTSSGRLTYAVIGTTDIRRDGQTIALSALKVGETVLVHVYPTGSSYTAERILAGNPGFGRRGPDGGAPPQNGTSGTSTQGTRTT
jgi:hypothetical protein